MGRKEDIYGMTEPYLLSRKRRCWGSNCLTCLSLSSSGSISLSSRGSRNVDSFEGPARRNEGSGVGANLTGWTEAPLGPS